MQRVLTFVMAGGRGERLEPLTRDRAKPAVPFGGIYRIIDFTLSNCLHSGLRQIYVLTQYKSLSLERHISFGWRILNPVVWEFVTTLPPQQRVRDEWYLGTADAIYQNWYSVQRQTTLQQRPKHILILAGDHVYKMDYAEMIRFHEARDADLTVGVIHAPLEAARGQLGVLRADAGGWVQSFAEKPADPAPSPDHPQHCLASMGIYCFKTDALETHLHEDAADPASSHDFGRDIVARMLGREKVAAFHFERANRNPSPYWRDVGTLDAYWAAHQDLVQVVPEFNLYDPEWPIHTFHPPWPPAKSVHEEAGRTGQAVNSLLSPGTIVSGARAIRSVLSPGVRLNSFSQVEECVLLDGVNVGRGAKLRRAILDKGVQVKPGAELGVDPEADAARFTVTPGGIVVVAKEETVG